MYYVFDVDGTICFDGQVIDDEIKEALRKLIERDDVIFASARPIRDLLPVIQGLEQSMLVGGNGSIVSVDGAIRVMDYIQCNEYSVIKQLIKEFNLQYIIDGLFDYSSNVKDSHPIKKQLDPAKLANNVAISQIDKPIKIILVDIPAERYNDILNVLSSYSNNLSINNHDHERNIDMTAKGINKYTTLRQLIGDAKYVAYGNDINDYDLLKNAHISHYVKKVDGEELLKCSVVLNDDIRSLSRSIHGHLTRIH